MKAITCHRYGAPEDVLHVAEVDEPRLDAHAVVVEVHAASVNPADWHLIRGIPFVARLQIGMRRPGFEIPGSDVAGRVVAIGSDVTRVAVGDDVFGTTFMRGFGAFAERVAVPEELVVRIPAGISYDEAAAVPLAGLTALQALRDHGRIEAGHQVLVIGASGGVGSSAVQIARSFGADVAGVCRTANADAVRALGAHRVIDHTEPGWSDGAGRYDLVIQAGGTQTPSECLRLLHPDGTLVQISGDSDNRWFGPIGRIIGGRRLDHRVTQTITTFTVQPNGDDLAVLASLLADRSLTPVIDTTYRLDQVDAAIHHVERGHTRGKVVLHPRPEPFLPRPAAGRMSTT